MEKKKVSQDFIYKNIIQKYGVNVSSLAELMGISDTMVNGCFRHNKDKHGVPRNFPARTLPKLNAALAELSEQLSQCRISFGSEKTYTNRLGNTYDPAAVNEIKELRKYFKLTPFLKTALGWTEAKKAIVLGIPSSKGYACVSAEDVQHINDTIQEIAILFGGVEVEASDSSTSSFDEPQTAEPKINKVRTRKGMEASFESPKYEWDDTSLPLSERTAILRQRWPNGMLLFRVNGGYTAEGDDAHTVHDLLPDVSPYTNFETGLTTAWMTEEQMTQVLSRFIAQGRRVMITNMYAE